MTLTPNINVFQ